MKWVVKPLQGLYPGLRVWSQCKCNILVRHGALSGLESNRNKGNLYTRPDQRRHSQSQTDEIRHIAKCSQKLFVRFTKHIQRGTATDEEESCEDGFWRNFFLVTDFDWFLIIIPQNPCFHLAACCPPVSQVCNSAFRFHLFLQSWILFAE